MKRGYKQTDVGMIPEEWEVASIGSLASFTSGIGISIAELSRQSSDTPVPVFGGNGIAGYTTAPLVRQPVVVVGRVGQKCGEVYLTEGPAWISDNALYPRTIFRPLDVRFFALALEAAGLNDVKNRNDLPLVTQSILHAVRIAWPPDPDEQRIVADALSDVDALLGALDRLIAKKRDLKQAAMQQLLTGQTRLPGFGGTWEVKRFGELVFPRRDRVDPRRSGVHEFCVEMEHIESASGRLLGSTSTSEQSSLKSVFRVGDVLFGKLRAYLRKYWLATRLGICSTEIWVFTPKDPSITTDYLFQVIRADEFIETASNAYGTHMPRSDWNIVKNYELKLPPIPEQSAIVAVLSDMDAELANLEQRRDKTRALKQGMMQELLTGKTRLV